MLTPKNFVKRWGKKGEPLIRFTQEAVEQLNMADEDKEFLTQAGLPEAAAPFLNFEAPADDELPTVAKHFRQPARFARYRIIGFDGSGSPVAIDEKESGAVVCLDHDEKFERSLMNTTVRQLAESVLVYRDLVASAATNCDEVPENLRQKAMQAIKKIDAAAVQPGCFWAAELKIADVKEDYPTKELRELLDADAKVRLRASRRLQSELRKGHSKQREELFGNRQATTALIAALDDAAPEVVRNALIALAMIAANYFQDDRAYPKVLQGLRSKDVMTQIWALCAAVRLRGQDSLDDVLPLCKDRSPLIRNRVFYELFRWLMENRPAAAKSLRPQSRQRLLKTALQALNGTDAEMRGSAAFLLCELGDAAAVAAALKKERNQHAKQSLQSALQMTGERS